MTTRKPPAAPAADTKIEVSAQLLNFDTGLYSVQLAAPQTATIAPGLRLPCIRLDPMATDPAARAFVSTLSDSELIQPGDHSAYLRVRGGNAPVLLTIYKLAGGMAAPELRIKLVQPHVAAAESETLPSEPLQLVAHVGRTGDVTVAGGAWAGTPSGAPRPNCWNSTPSGRMGEPLVMTRVRPAKISLAASVTMNGFSPA